ncbi:TPA: hypothetical protein ACWXN0_003520 [Escherichia coli]
MGSCAAPSVKGDDKFITTDYLQQCPPSRLTFSRSNGLLKINNASAFYVTLVNMSINDKKLDTAMVPPKSSIMVNLPKGVTVGKLSYQTINDYGANTPVTQVKIN